MADIQTGQETGQATVPDQPNPTQVDPPGPTQSPDLPGQQGESVQANPSLGEGPGYITYCTQVLGGCVTSCAKVLARCFGCFGCLCYLKVVQFDPDGKQFLSSDQYKKLIEFEEERKVLFNEEITLEKAVDDTYNLMSLTPTVLMNIVTGISAACYLITQNKSFERNSTTAIYYTILAVVFVLTILMPLCYVHCRLQHYIWAVKDLKFRKQEFVKKVSSFRKNIPEDIGQFGDIEGGYLECSVRVSLLDHGIKLGDCGMCYRSVMMIVISLCAGVLGAGIPLSSYFFFKIFVQYAKLPQLMHLVS